MPTALQRFGKAPQKGTAPRKPPPRLSPKGFAVDLTPSTKRVAPQYRGAAILNRGWGSIVHHDLHPGLKPQEKKAVKILATDRHQLLRPQNQKYLSLLQRTQPGSTVHNAIYSNPHLATQHQLLKAGISVKPESRLKLQQHGMNDDQIDRLAAGQMTPDAAVSHVHQLHVAAAQAHADKLTAAGHPATVNPVTAGIVPQAAGGWFGRLVGGGLDTAIGLGPGLYELRHPVRTIPKIAAGTYHSFGETVTHPVRQLQEDPFSFLTNVGTVAGAGVGLAGRTAGALEAANLARTGATARAAGVTQAIPNVVADWLPQRVAEKSTQMGAGRAAAYGFTHPRVRNVLDLMDQKSPLIPKEQAQIAEHVAQQMNTVVPHRKGVKSKFFGTYGRGGDVHQALGQTLAWDKGLAKELRDKHPGTYTNVPLSHAAALGHAALRELTDGVRAGTIYARPAYLPNNWAGNVFMNLIHQGAYAPVNLAKSLYMSKALNRRELRTFDAMTGETAARAIAGSGKGYVRALTDPLVKALGKGADVPFRRAAVLHEFRRAGYRTLDEVKQAMKEFSDASDNLKHAHTQAQIDQATATMNHFANIARKGQNEVVKFSKLSDAEQHVIKNIFFVWNWTKGSAFYTARFPLVHPVQTGLMAQAAQVGNREVQRKIGGLPPYLVGSTPVGHGKMSNPFAVSPFSSAAQLYQAGRGTVKAFQGKFDPHTMTDLTQMMLPQYQAYIQSQQGAGGRNYLQNLGRNIAPIRLYQGLMHPGSGSIFPGTRWEALGHYTLGSLYPRKYDPQALQSALERMNINHPEALIPAQIKQFQKAKIPVDPKIVAGYKRDIVELQNQKDFKTSSAHSHNAPSYRKMAPIDQAHTALDYLTKYNHLPPDRLAEYQKIVSQIKTDSEAKVVTRGLWKVTAAGEYKKLWQLMEKQSKAGRLTPSK